jgi:hypothetical protein
LAASQISLGSLLLVYHPVHMYMRNTYASVRHEITFLS